jgi:O-antigen/teichoic acid export membrane protein
MQARQIVRNVISQWGAHVITAALGIVMPPFLLDRLGKDGYGLNNLIGDLGGYSTILYFGFGAAVVRHVAACHARDEQTNLNETVSTVFMVYLRIGAVCVLAATALAWPLPWIFDIPPALVTESRLRLVLTGVAVLVDFVGSVFGGVLMGLERYDMVNGIRLIALAFRTVAVLVAVSLWRSILALGVVAVLTSLTEQAAYYYYAHRVMPALRVTPALNRPDRVASLFTFSIQSFVFTMSDRVINYTDSLVIGQARGASATGPYAFALRLVDFAREAIDRAAGVLMPGFAAAAAQGRTERVRAFWRTGSKAIITLAGPIALVQTLWGRHVLTLWLSHNSNAADAARVVAEAAPCMVWLSLAFLMQMAGRGLARPLFEGLGELRVPARIAMMEAAANLLLSVILVRTWGVQGVAFATFLPAAIAGLVVMPWYVCDHLEIPFRQHVWESYVRGFAPALPAYGVLLAAEALGWHRGFVSLALTCALVLLVWVAAAAAITFDRAERDLLRGRFRSEA